MVATGCDILSLEGFSRCSGERVGILCNPASVDGGLRHISLLCADSKARLACLFGPQHGYQGDTQANMIEWEGYTHPGLGIPVYSLYGETRRPRPEMLEGLDTVIIDLPDIGARPYTYLWTSLLMMEECARAGIKVIAADRPNPIGGITVEGGMLDMRYRSFVGLFPLVMRHGLTAGEALSMIDGASEAPCDPEVVRMKGWRREMRWSGTGLPWVLPSPNMPTPETALVYPGTVMLEATNISEGRGTTRPFEIVGAPWIDSNAFAEELAGAARRYGLEGVFFRPMSFRPAWDKYSGELCGGVQIHVTSRDDLRPVRCAAVLMEAAARLYPESFSLLPPPYEYEEDLMPIDILSGDAELREALEGGGGLEGLFERWDSDEAGFESERERFLLY